MFPKLSSMNSSFVVYLVLSKIESKFKNDEESHLKEIDFRHY